MKPRNPIVSVRFFHIVLCFGNNSEFHLFPNKLFNTFKLTRNAQCTAKITKPHSSFKRKIKISTQFKSLVFSSIYFEINSQDLFDVSYPKGPNAPAEQILNEVPGADDPEYQPFPYDPDGAREALAASSYGSAENLPKIMFVGISFPAAEAAAQYIAEQWRQVLGIESVEMKPQYDDYSGPDQENVQIFRDDVATRFPDTVNYLLGSIHSSSGNAQNKMGGYANAEVDRLVEEAATKGTDDPERVNLALQANRLFREDWQFIPWYHETNGKMSMPWVQNHVLNMDWQRVDPWEISIEA